MNFNLSVINRSHEENEPEKDLMEVVNSMYREEDPIFDELDKKFAVSSKLMILHSLTKEYPNDSQLESLIGFENLLIAQSNESIGSALKSVGASMHVLGMKIVKMMDNKTVSEKYIYKRFDKLRDAINACENQRAMVYKVPSFDTCLKRLVGVINVANFLEQLAGKDPHDNIFQDTLFDKVAALSNGVLKVVSAREDSGLKNLAWEEPYLEEYDLMSSPWMNTQKRESIRNLILKCKYQGSDSFTKAAKKIHHVVKSYSVNEFLEGNNDYEDQLAAYNSVYLVSKMCKQAYNIGIERELNNFCISYIHRLCSYKYI